MNWSRLISTTRDGSSDHPIGDRAEFEDDLGRVVFSAPVPRSRNKTHVSPLEPHDSVPTCLTHSLEASNVRCLVGRIPPEYAHAVSTIAASCALLHGAGTTPCGHAGEKAIQDWFHQELTGNRALAAVFVDHAACSSGVEKRPAAGRIPARSLMARKLEGVHDGEDPDAGEALPRRSGAVPKLTACLHTVMRASLHTAGLRVFPDTREVNLNHFPDWTLK